MFSKKPEEPKQISTVKLKNGTEVIEPVLITTMINLDALMKKNPIAFYELVQKCRNPQHKMFGNTEQVAESLALIERGSIHDSVRNIVLSAVEGDGLKMSLSSPVASSVTNKI